MNKVVRWLLLIAMSCIIPSLIQAQGVATVATSGVVAKKLLNQFEDASNRLLQNAGQQGDILASKLGDELRVATQNASIALASQQNKLFEQLKPDEQQLFIAMNSMIEVANKATGRATTLAEVANLNLIEFTNRVPFTRKVNFYLSSIDGLTQPYSHTPYDLHLRGLGVGIAPGDRKYSIHVSVGGKELPPNAIRAISATDSDIEIPNEFLEPLFQENKAAQVSLVLRSEVTTDEKIMLIIPHTVTKTYEVPVLLILLPKSPGSLKGTEPLISQVLDTTVHTTSITHHTVGCHTDHPCDWNQTLDLALDEFAFNVRYSCAGQCPWDYKYRPHAAGHEYEPDFDILNDGHKVVVYRHNDGEHDTTVTHYVDFHKLIPLVQPHNLGPYKLKYGEPLIIDLDPANSDCAYQLNGELVTKQTPYIDSAMAESAEHLLVKNSVIHFGNHCRVTLTLQQR
jgi:hypothetical protein